MTSRKKKLGLILLAIACAGAAGSGASTYIKNLTGTGTFNYNTSGTITTPNSTGTLAITSGNVATATALASNPADCASNTFANAIAASGDLTCTSVPNAALATMNAHTFKGNNTGSSATPSDLSIAQLTAELNAVVGDSGSGGTKGLVPAPASGDTAAGKFLKADGTWTVPSGAGDVTGPAASVDSELVLFSSTSGKVIKRASGNGAVSVSSGVVTQGTLSVPNGGTGQTSYGTAGQNLRAEGGSTPPTWAFAGSGGGGIEWVIVATSCSSTPCTITSQSDASGNWVSSISRAGTGDYTVNFTSSYFSVAPACFCSSDQAQCGPADVPSTSSVRILTGNSAGTAGNGKLMVFCAGKR
jgi:hypothetical protein